MKIKKIQLKNGYKRFFDLTIDLGDEPKRIIALVGPNGCGKSSVFDGMCFHGTWHGHLIGDKGQKDYNYHSMNQLPNFSTLENVIIEFTTGNYKGIIEEKAKSGKEKTIFSLRSSYRYNSDLKVKESKATTEIRLNKYGASSFSDLDDKMNENYRRLRIKYEKYREDDENCTTRIAKEKIIGDINSAIGNCLDLEITSLGNIPDNRGTLYFKKNDQPDQPNEFEFNVLSSGEKEVIDILLDLYLRQEEYADSIFIIDEPELHINTAIQRKLLIEINKLIGENCQIWIATHSIGFMRALQEDFKDDCQIIHFEANNQWASSVHTLRPMEKTISNWKNIFGTALDDLTNLICPKRLIYCEGRGNPGPNAREEGLDAQVFNNIFNKKYTDTLFVSSGGNTELDQRSEIAFAILSKAIPDLEIFVLKDRDIASGKNTDEDTRKIYLEINPDNHRMLGRLEIENYLYDKEVLKKYCMEKELSFDEETYDEKVTDIENQNLKDITSTIKNICDITISINPEKFKLNLSKLISEDMSIFKELEGVIFSSDKD